MPSALSVLGEFLFICLWEHCWSLIKCPQEGQVSLQSLCRMWPLATENFTGVLSQGSHPCTAGTVNPEDTTAIYKLSDTEKKRENWFWECSCMGAEPSKKEGESLDLLCVGAVRRTQSTWCRIHGRTSTDWVSPWWHHTRKWQYSIVQGEKENRGYKFHVI